MAVSTLNVSLSEEQVSLINREVDSGLYASASEVVREAIREWIKKRIEEDVSALERAHSGAWERDTTPQEEKLILDAVRAARGRKITKTTRAVRRK
jgi:antitoxin ParD1/3/4